MLTYGNGDYIRLAVKTHVYDLNVRVLIYKEDDSIVAHALELDLLGYGKSIEEAKTNLKKAIDEQIRFCSHVDQPAMAHFPAPQEYFDRWEKAQRDSINCVLDGCDAKDHWQGRAEFITLDAADLQRLNEQGKKMKGPNKKPVYEPVACGKA